MSVLKGLKGFSRLVMCSDVKLGIDSFLILSLLDMIVSRNFISISEISVVIVDRLQLSH